MMRLRGHRGLWGVLLAGLMFAVLTPLLAAARAHVSFASDVALYLLVVVLTSLAGGFGPALVAAVAGSLLLNFYFAPPLHTLTIDEGSNVLALVIFLLIATLVSRVVHVARAVEPLAESERARTALLNALSHDLRTPIASAKAAVSSLRSADVAWSDSDRNELLLTADTSLDRLTDLVTNLLDLSRLQAGVLPVHASPVGVDDVISRALAHAAPHWAELDVDVPADLPDVIADAGLLERVIANLVQNAARYAPPGTRVRIGGSTHAGHVEVRIVDHGSGIDQAETESVFAAFQRRDDSSADGAGVGLGLAIARGFTEAMGGTVHAEQTPGGGATLVVRLATPGERI